MLKKQMLFMVLCICLFFCISNVNAMECQIVDEEGNAIYSANAGDLVYFMSTYAYSKSKKLSWNLMVTLPSVDTKNYKTSMKHNGYFFHQGSLESESHVIPIMIPADSFIEGNATFKYTLTANGNCVFYLNISQESEPPSEPTLTATAVSSSRINLSWTSASDNIGVVGYKVYAQDGTYIKSVNGNLTYFDGLSPNTQYCYTITAYDAAGNESTNSNQACATTLPSSATTPSINDFVGTWQGNLTFLAANGETGTCLATLNLSINSNQLTGQLSGPACGKGWTDNISGTVTNGIFSFTLPNSEPNNPDCANWYMPVTAMLSADLKTMNFNASGTVCSSSGGQSGTFTGSLIKQNSSAAFSSSDMVGIWSGTYSTSGSTSYQYSVNQSLTITASNDPDFSSGFASINSNGSVTITINMRLGAIGILNGFMNADKKGISGLFSVNGNYAGTWSWIKL